jgi:hypothetical protein
VNNRDPAVQPQVHRLFLALITILLILGCSAYEPEVLGVTARELRFIDGSGAPREELMLELEVRDQDGFSELHRAYVIHDSRELYWEVSSESWQADPQEGVIRLRRLATPRGEPLPRGGYRVQLLDLGGRSGERSFTLPLLPEESLLQEREDRLRRVEEYLALLREQAPLPGEEPPWAETLRGIGLLLIPAGAFESRLLLPLEELVPLEPAQRQARLAAATREEGRIYLASRMGEVGPVYLLEMRDLGSSRSKGRR